MALTCVCVQLDDGLSRWELSLAATRVSLLSLDIKFRNSYQPSKWHSKHAYPVCPTCQENSDEAVSC